MPELTLDRLPEGWDDASDAYDVVAVPVTSQYARDLITALDVQDGDRVLDVAAGSGSATFAALDADAHVVATDFSPRMIERLRAKLADSGALGAETMVMDGQSLKFGDETFDRVVSVFGLIFFPNRVQGFREMFRVLTPGGRAGIASWSTAEKTFPIAVWGQVLREVLPDLPKPAEPPAVYSLQDPELIRSEMESAGFEKVSITPVVHTFDAASPSAFWDEWHRASPVFTTLMEKLGAKVDDYRDALIARVEEKFGKGPIQMPAEGLIAVGVKPSA